MGRENVWRNPPDQSTATNPGWSFPLDPDTLTFFTKAIEVCDSSIVYAENHRWSISSTVWNSGPKI
ncbi:BP74-related protein [Nocardia sp. IBHARD005]|uniref:BP74-related protein n=1 Tax=Nocardia sp. IBHARD005 TaxID=3457765 RepID=UPI0040591946